MAEQSLRWSFRAVTVFVQERLLAKQWALGLHDQDPFLAQRTICPNEGDLYPLGTDRRLAVRPRAIDERADSRRFVVWDCKFPIVRHVSGYLPGDKMCVVATGRPLAAQRTISRALDPLHPPKEPIGGQHAAKIAG